MMGKTFSLVTSVIWIGNLISLAVYAQEACSKGWFGSECQYKCHCTNNKCDNNGDCRDGDTCVKGWFGPQCQYVDLAFTENTGINIPVLTDADDTTCINDVHQMLVTLGLKRTFPFTWLRLHFSTEGELQNINVNFTDSSTGNTYKCNNKRSALVDSRTIDIYCDVDTEVDRVTFAGKAIGYLCSIYVSGGRNVALKQSQVSQSSTYTEEDRVCYYGGCVSETIATHEASNAVDGDTNQYFSHGSCTHTLQSDSYPNWTVQFAQISDVNRYVIYNRVDDGLQKRLAGFVLTSFDTNDVQVFQHIDTETSNGLPVYDITTATHASSINRVNIKVHQEGKKSYLHMCEVEIFGDSHCPAGKYGRECDHNCSCHSVNEQCFVSTGGCPSGCAAGYMGESCDKTCSPGTYGSNCAVTCSNFCQDQLKCDHISGRCEECVWGKHGALCDSDCPLTKYGPRCIHECSTNCSNQQCEGATGTCIQCPTGTTGTQCDQDCESGKYGQGCSEECSQFCKTVNGTGDNESLCHHVNGTCFYGCIQGYQGSSCKSEKQSSSPGLGVWLGIGLGAAALIVIIGVAIYCCRKRSKAQRSRNQRPAAIDQPKPKTEEHNYIVLFKSGVHQ